MQKLRTAPDLTEGSNFALPVAILIHFVNVTRARGQGLERGLLQRVVTLRREAHVLALGPVFNVCDTFHRAEGRRPYVGVPKVGICVFEVMSRL